MPAAAPPEGVGEYEVLETRLAALERAVEATGAELRTRRLVVVDAEGHERIVGEVCQGTAELRLEIPGGRPGSRSAVVLFASPLVPGPDPGGAGFGPAVGIQLWAEGDAVAEIDAWPDGDGRWQAHVHWRDEPV
jgi:hypothetical protein